MGTYPGPARTVSTCGCRRPPSVASPRCHFTWPAWPTTTSWISGLPGSNGLFGPRPRRRGDGGPGAASLDIPRISGQIHEVKRQGALAMVVVHAGREYLPVPAPHIRHAFRALAAAGADLIVGHHPHVPQGMELVDG